MTKRKMFLRMVTSSLLRRRSRMLIALLSIAIGATILAGLVTIYVDVPRQMGAQFRSYGANMLILPREGETLPCENIGVECRGLVELERLVDHRPLSAVRLEVHFEKLIRNDPQCADGRCVGAFKASSLFLPCKIKIGIANQRFIPACDPEFCARLSRKQCKFLGL